MGWSAGFTLLYVGGVGMFGGSCDDAREIAACTSCAAPSMLRLRSNCNVMDVPPSELDEVIVSMPAIVENCFSRGVAIAEATVSGLAPGNEAPTSIVG